MRFLMDEFKKTIRSNQFLMDQKRLASSLRWCTKRGYSAGKKEPDLIKDIVCRIKKEGGGFLSVKLNAEFIHGNLSQVTYGHIHGKNSVELGDLIIISSITKNGIVLFRKVSFNQAKKSNHLVWKLEPNQLYLLSHFPTFTGVKGIFSKTKCYCFRNNSRCLGSYLLLNPNDMIFISAFLLDTLCSIQNSKSFSLKKNIDSIFPFYFASKIAKKDYFRNTLLCMNHFDFVEEWTQFNIGEMIISSQKLYYPPNTQVKESFVELMHQIQQRKPNILSDLGLSDMNDTNEAHSNSKEKMGFDSSLAILHMNIKLKEED